MKATRLLFLVMVICLSSGVKAQFYDGPDDIYFYVQIDDNGEFKDNGWVRIFNFDGKKAALLNFTVISNGFEYDDVSMVKTKIKSNPEFYELRVEDNDYDVKWTTENAYIHEYSNTIVDFMGYTQYFKSTHTYNFSSDRNFCYEKVVDTYTKLQTNTMSNRKKYKKVDKSFFKSGRSRTPNSTLHE